MKRGLNSVEIIDKHNIPTRYKVPLHGIINKGVYDCFKCYGYTPSHRHSPYNVTEDILGFAESTWGMMVVWRCKNCGQVYFFHLREKETMNSSDYVKTYHEFISTGKWNY